MNSQLFKWNARYGFENWFVWAILMTLVGFPSGIRAEEERGSNAPVTHLFIPPGFDDNDRAEVVIDGYLPNSCYQLDKSSVVLDRGINRFKIFQKMRRVRSFCPQALVPFTKVFELGRLWRGDYEVVVVGSLVKGTVHVSQGGEDPDSFFYAPLDRVYVRSNSLRNGHEAVLEGRYTSHCMKWDQVEIIDHEKVIEVLPKVRFLKDTGCETTVEKPFQEVLPLPLHGNGRTLLHVRSMSGGSFNVVYDSRFFQ